MKKLIGLWVALVFLAVSTFAHATPAYQRYTPEEWFGTTSGTTPADTSCVFVQSAVYSQWGDGLVEVTSISRAFLNASNSRIISRKFLVTVSGGTMSLVAEESLFGDASVGIGLLLASVTATVDNTNHKVCTRVTGVTGQTVRWLTTTSGNAFAN